MKNNKNKKSKDKSLFLKDRNRSRSRSGGQDTLESSERSPTDTESVGRDDRPRGSPRLLDEGLTRSQRKAAARARKREETSRGKAADNDNEGEASERRGVDGSAGGPQDDGVRASVSVNEEECMQVAGEDDRVRMGNEGKRRYERGDEVVDTSKKRRAKSAGGSVEKKDVYVKDRFRADRPRGGMNDVYVVCEDVRENVRRIKSEWKDEEVREKVVTRSAEAEAIGDRGDDAVAGAREVTHDLRAFLLSDANKVVKWVADRVLHQSSKYEDIIGRLVAENAKLRGRLEERERMQGSMIERVDECMTTICEINERMSKAMERMNATMKGVNETVEKVPC